jgi:hypothetical protein
LRDMVTLQVHHHRAARERDVGVHRADDPTTNDYDATSGQRQVVSSLHEGRI